MTKEELIAATELFLLDLDGTVYLGETPVGNMAETLSRLRGMGKKLVFLTNNSSRTEEQYREKLVRIGLYGEGDGIFTSGTAAIDFLKREHAGERVYLVGTEKLRARFLEEGIPLDENEPDLCLLAYDTELTFEKLRRLDFFLGRGKPFYATHPDDVCPTPYGSMPDVGSFLALLERSSGRKPDLVIGKPYSAMGESLARVYRVPRGRMCMAGDRMYTDIRFANNNGMRSVLVLSGETDEAHIGDFPDRPDLILPDLNALFREP